MSPKKIVSTSAQLVALISVLSVAYGFVISGFFDLGYAYTANFWAGAVIITAGLSMLFVPTFLLMKKDKLIDHTTYGQRFMKEREKKLARARELICIGMCNITITAVVQLILFYSPI